MTMRVKSPMYLCDDNGAPIREGTNIYDAERGFIGTFAGFREETEYGSMEIAIDDPQNDHFVTQFPIEKAAKWSTKPIEPAAPIDEAAGDLEDAPHGSRDVIEAGSTEIQYRFAKEAIGIATIELNRAYAEFTIDRDGFSIPTSRIQEACERLHEAMKYLDIDGDSIPF